MNADELTRRTRKGNHLTSDNLLEESLLTVRQAAQLLNMHSNTLRRWTERGILRAYRIGRRGDRRLRRADITRLIAELQTNDGDERKARSAQIRD